MGKNEINSINPKFLENISEVLVLARKKAKTAVNLSMVYAYYEIGRMIVEEEQRGEQRAAYGTQRQGCVMIIYSTDVTSSPQTV